MLDENLYAGIHINYSGEKFNNSNHKSLEIQYMCPLYGMSNIYIDYSYHIVDYQFKSLMRRIVRREINKYFIDFS